MSLLMEALRRAEQAKQPVPAGEPPPAQLAETPAPPSAQPEPLPAVPATEPTAPLETPAPAFHEFDWGQELHLADESPADAPAQAEPKAPSLFELLEQEIQQAHAETPVLPELESPAPLLPAEAEQPGDPGPPAQQTDSETPVLPAAEAADSPAPLPPLAQKAAEARPNPAPILALSGAPARRQGARKGLLILLALTALLVGGGLGYLYYLDEAASSFSPPLPAAEEGLSPLQSIIRANKEKEKAPAATPVTPPEATAVAPQAEVPPVEPLRIIAPPAPPVPERAPPRAPQPAPPPRQAAAEAFPPTGLQIRKQPQPQSLQHSLNEAYTAYQSGNQMRAGQLYQRALAQDPRSRDALLGLAGLAVLRGEAQAAREYYEKVLKLYPDDPVALAELLNLNGQTDSETQLKLLLGQKPEAAWLHFQLGNVYQRQGRWREAQQAYFDAFHHDKTQPDYAYNLAVSLDRLGKSRQALDFYAQALALAAPSTGSGAASSGAAAHFDPASVIQRIQALQSSPEPP